MCSNAPAHITRSPGRCTTRLSGLFVARAAGPLERSTHQSTHVVMPAHHMRLYLVIEDTKGWNEVDTHPQEEHKRGAA
jgi:hypothetical protein